MYNITFNLAEFIDWKYLWSVKTFGHGQRAEGICKHIESELDEIRETPTDLNEWVDVILLALDGASRANYTGEQIVEALVQKQTKNIKRKWDKVDENSPSFHKE